MKRRETVSYFSLALILPYLGWSVWNMENQVLFQPQASYHPKNPGLYRTYTSLLKANAQELCFLSEPGVELYAWYIPAAENKPTILFAHGNGGHLGDRWQVIQAFAEQGYGVFAFDYRGYSLSTGSPSEQGLYRDMLAASHYLEASLGVPPSRQIAVGESLGSAVAVETALKVPFKAVLLYSSLTTTPEVAAYLAQSHHLGLLANVPAMIMRQRFESIKKISKVRSPLFIVHGTSDHMMPLWMPEKLYKQAQTPHKHLMIIPGAGHNDIFQTAQEQILREFNAFLAKVEADQNPTHSLSGS